MKQKSNKTIKNIIKESVDDYLNERNQVSDDEETQQLIDIISMNPKKYKKYIDLLKNKHGIDFYDYYNDEKHIENANLSDIKNKDDFLNFDNYIKYAKKIFNLRNIEQPKQIDKEIDHKAVEEIGNKLGFNIKVKEYDGVGNYASFDFNNTITLPQIVDVNTLIHEIGHYFDHNYSNGYTGLAKTITYASSPYHIDKNSEVFAENFLHYFIAPNLLKKHLPEVYEELDKNIPQKFKIILNGILN